MKVYQYVIFFDPDEDDENETRKAQIIVEPTTILAASEQAAQMKAARAISEEWENDLDDLTIVMRPF